MNTVKIDLIGIFSSLANETRLSIVRKLAKECEAVDSQDIVASCAEFLKLSQPTMSHHFAKLVSAGVIIQQKVGVENRYRLNQELLERIGIDTGKF